MKVKIIRGKVKGVRTKKYGREQQKRFRKDNPMGFHIIQAKYHLRKMPLDVFRMLCNDIHKEKVKKSKVVNK